MTQTLTSTSNAFLIQQRSREHPLAQSNINQYCAHWCIDIETTGDQFPNPDPVYQV